MLNTTSSLTCLNVTHQCNNCIKYLFFQVFMLNLGSEKVSPGTANSDTGQVHTADTEIILACKR